MVVVNMAGVPLAGEPLAEGMYKATVTKVTPGKTKEGNDPKLTFEFTVSEGEASAGQKAWRHFTFSEKALPFFKSAMVNLGVDPEVLEGSFDTDTCAEDWDLIGTECAIRVTHDPSNMYNGRPSTNVAVLSEDSWTT